MRIARLVAVACFAATAMTAVAGHAKADDFAKVHTVAVVVVTGNDIKVRKLSVLSFEEGTQYFRAKTDIVGAIKHYVETALATRFKVEQADADGATLHDLKGDDFIAALRQMRVAGEPPDAFVVISLNFHSFGRIEWSGIGLDLVGDDGSTTALYTHIFLEVIDPRTGERIAHGDGRFPHGGVFSGPQPIQICDRRLWPGDVAHMTSEQQALIETEVMASLKAIIPYMLDDAGLPAATGYDGDTHPGDALATGVCHRP